MRTKLTRLLPLFLVAVLSLGTIIPLLRPGLFLMHDDQQIARLFEFHRALVAFQFPVRWVEGLGFGFGYPLFNFYPPFVYYLGEIFHLIGFSFIDSVKLVWATALLGSALSMYFLSREFFGKVPAVVAAVFYLYAPYHAVDAYVRGALAELFSFVWLPLILLFAYRAARYLSLKNSLLTALFLSLLMLTHNLIFLPFLPFVIAWYFFFALAHNRDRFFVSVIHFLLFTAFTFGLTASFVFPALLEKKFTLVDSLLIKNLASYKLHFVCPSQLWNSLWGYGGSTAGCLDGLSFKVGKLHLLISLAALILAVIFRPKRYRIFLTFLLLLFSLFMTTAFASPFWDIVQPLWYLQFPWRFLEFTTLFSSLLAAAFMGYIPKPLKYFAAASAILIVIFLNGKYFVPTAYRLDLTDDKATTWDEVAWRVSSTSFEYLPAGFATRLTPQKTVGVDLEKTDLTQSKFHFLSGTPQVLRENFSPHKFTLVTSSPTASVLRLNITHFPGWLTYLDGKLAPFSDNNPYRLLTLNIPPGTHTVEGIFTDTPVRTLSNLVSVLSFLIFAVLLWRVKFHEA